LIKGGFVMKLGLRKICALLLVVTSVGLVQCAGETVERHAVPRAVGRTSAEHAARIAATQRAAGPEYGIARVGAVTHAANPAHDFGVDFAHERVAFDRSNAWHAEVCLAHVGSASGTLVLPPTEIRTEGNRVEYRRGAVTEWYVNGPLGLEQGFTIASPPPHASGEHELRVDLDIAGDLTPVASGLDVVDLRDARGRTGLRVRNVFASDARGESLAASLRVEDGKLRIRVDDGDAAYPIVIDPTYSQEAELVASDAAPSSYFGIGVAIDGDTAVVGAKTAGGRGAAYVFTRRGTSWIQQQELVASDAATGDQFGSAVAVSGDAIAIGAPRKASARGTIYVFQRTAGTWVETRQFTGSAANDFFGSTLAMSDTTLAVGAALRNGMRGGASVFTRTRSGWLPEAEIAVVGGAANDRFGVAIAIDGDTLVGGANNADGKGAAYVFTRTASTWTQRAKLVASDGAAGNMFGRSVAVSGDIAVVGASQKSSAYVFGRRGTDWSQQAKWTSTSGAVADQFGWSVSVKGDVAAVSAALEGTGAVYQFFQTQPGTWTQQAKFVGSDAVAGDGFGVSLAASETTILVGASGKNSVTGATYVFSVQPPSMSASCSDAPCVPDSTITATWSSTPGYAADWIAIAPKDSVYSDATNYAYTGGALNGSTVFTGLPPGEYVARAFANDTDAILAESAPFTVATATTGN
jgi:hypothetical protein